MAQFGGLEQVVTVYREAHYVLHLRHRLLAHEAHTVRFGLLCFARAAFELHVGAEFGDTAAGDTDAVNAVLQLHELATDGQDEELLLSTAGETQAIVERDGADAGLVVAGLFGVLCTEQYTIVVVHDRLDRHDV